MSSALITFNEARAHADRKQGDEAEPAKFAKRTKQTQLASVDVKESRDDRPTNREIALRVWKGSMPGEGRAFHERRHVGVEPTQSRERGPWAQLSALSGIKRTVPGGGPLSRV